MWNDVRCTTWRLRSSDLLVFIFYGLSLHRYKILCPFVQSVFRFLLLLFELFTLNTRFSKFHFFHQICTPTVRSTSRVAIVSFALTIWCIYKFTFLFVLLSFSQLFPFFLRFFLSTDLSSLSLHSEVRDSFFIPSSSVLYCRFASECLDWTVSLSAEVCSLMSSLRPSWLRFSSMRSSVDETFSFGSFFLFLLGLSGCLLFRE
jgi:hypothetical protein